MTMPFSRSAFESNMLSGLMYGKSATNDSTYAAYDYHLDTNENMNYSSSIFAQTSEGSQRLASILQHLFNRMSDNHSLFRPYPNSKTSMSSSSPTSVHPSSVLSLEILLPSDSAEITRSYQYLALISLWFVLIINPIVILFGVIGNLLATYILIHCNIAKLPVSFYTIMLNISDTLNLLIPVFIFWLDNCFNRVPDRGYFRDKSNFLCKALMCPDQLFAALSAWYMCAISFNRWYSVCRPSTYFFRTVATNAYGLTPQKTTQKNSNENQRKSGKSSSSSKSTTSCIKMNFPSRCHCFKTNLKFRQHFQAFRSIGCITLTAILCCLYPIFLHELRLIVASNEHSFDLKKKISHSYAVVWQRCYYSRKHEHAYDIIGIILTSFLHILPLTFVAAMNIMIIIRLRQRQRLMTASANSYHQRKRPTSSKRIVEISKRIENHSKDNDGKFSNETQLITHKDQGTITDLPLLIASTPSPQSITPIRSTTATTRRHHSRDRTITIMLVSVALSYLILTLPYRLFWLYNVYIKRMHPEKLNSSDYLLQMHYIDHVLRTIRNIHYGTNFVFFIFLSKTFRRRFQQTFIEKFFQTKDRFFRRTSVSYDSHTETNGRSRRTNSKSSKREVKTKKKLLRDDRIIVADFYSRSMFDENPSLFIDVKIPDVDDDQFKSAMEMENNHLSRQDEK